MTIFKACRPPIVPDLQISATAEVSDSVSLETARAFYAGQARELADALFASLPGGTIDALLVEMLDRKRSLFRVLGPPDHAWPGKDG